MSKLIVFSAPSGSGKSTIINYLLTQNLGLEFSISATSRAPRGEELHGKEYYFLTPDEFRASIANDEFLEYEEVYKNCFYGTLKSEVERIALKGKVAIADLDVVGGVNVKKLYGDKVLTVFIQPPSIDELRNRLEARKTDTPEKIAERIAKAEWEISFAPQFDVVIINDDLKKAKAETLRVIKEFLEI
jgi:guanylate kinase